MTDHNTDGFDLTRLAAELEVSGGHLAFTKLVRKAVSVGSAHQDLTSANEALNQLRIRTTETRKESVLETDEFGSASSEDGIIAGALLAHATVLYARATETKPIDRWKWFGRGMLTSGETEWHADIMQFRDKVIAHYGIGGGLADGPTVINALVLRPAPKNEIEIIFIENRTNTRATISAKIAVLSQRLLVVAREKYDRHLKEIYDYVLNAAQSDDVFRQTLIASQFDQTQLKVHNFLTSANDSGQDSSAHYFVRKKPDESIPREE